jgi:ribosomal protein S18 acetylase RimI-like enzyme
MLPEITVSEATPGDAEKIAEIHLTARLDAMPYLHLAHSSAETRSWFARTVGDPPSAWWVARLSGKIGGYMLLNGEDLDHLYVGPRWQRHGIGRKLLDKAKMLSPKRLALTTFKKNTRAQAFYEAHGFYAVGFTEGRNEENEPDMQYVWKALQLK